MRDYDTATIAQKSIAQKSTTPAEDLCRDYREGVIELRELIDQLEQRIMTICGFSDPIPPLAAAPEVSDNMLSNVQNCNITFLQLRAQLGNAVAQLQNNFPLPANQGIGDAKSR